MIGNKGNSSKKVGTMLRIPGFEIDITAVFSVAAILWVVSFAYAPQQYREVIALAGAAAAVVGALLAAFYAGRTLSHIVEQEKAKVSF
jgi:hypothetical protein